MVERVIASDTGLTSGQASYEYRSELQQLHPRVIGWTSPRRQGKAVADELEARSLSCDESVSQAAPTLIIDNRGAVPAELIRRQALVSGARVEATRGKISVKTSPDR